ncbi:MAG TPA: hypothetical protein VD968_05575 [Pyrinomonadaceae bacterium]|nr:hypothetical protein [Pyrinomonadaceae bacterium]
MEGFARAFAEGLDSEGAEFPVLVLHLPDWEKRLEFSAYAVSLPALQSVAGRKPALEAVPFDGGTEAVTAVYGEARLVIVEFPTPQHAFDADAAINSHLARLRAEGRPTPNVYKRVGNYSVFVFDAAEAEAAEQLAANVKYEKDVRWLGRNPHADEIAARAYTRKMGGVILTTLLTTGAAILLCLAVGGAVGGFIFLRRRSKTARQEVYSDAGGMMRLNLEDLNAPPVTRKLASRAEE